MAYIHVAIPLNISTFEIQIEMFDHYLTQLLLSSAAPHHLPSFVKSVRDIATFAQSRLHHLQTSIRFVDTILPEDTSPSAQDRTRRFIPMLLPVVATLIADINEKARLSREGDLFYPNGTLKNTSYVPAEFLEVQSRQKRFFTDLYLPSWHRSAIENIRRQQDLRRHDQLRRFLESMRTSLPPNSTTTPTPPLPPSPDYVDIHVTPVNHSYPSAPTHPFYANNSFVIRPFLPPIQATTAAPAAAVSDPPLPYPVLHTRTPIPAANTQIRTRRQLLAGIGVASGILGTFLGLFNQHEITQIQSQVSSLTTSTNLLINVAHTHDQQLHHLQNELTHLVSVITLLISTNPALVYAKLQSQLDIVADRLKILQDCVQQLQHQKLSITLLDLSQLHIMYQSVLTTANSKGYTLLPTKPQDFFQLDTSYIRTGANVLILVHVPCLTDNYLLTIYKFANLPYPVASFMAAANLTSAPSPLQPVHTVHDLLSSFSHPDDFTPATTAIHFVPESDLIAIGRNDGVSNRYKLLSNADLAGCVQRNHVYLCEHHQVLRTDLEGSCLGSLYLQSERGVRENCRIDKRPLRETVYQLSATDHLVVSPFPHTAQILCKNGSHYPIRLRSTSRITVPPACHLRLFNHTISSDDSIRVKPEPLQFSWSFNPLILPSELMQQSAHADDQMNQIKSEISLFNNLTLQHKDFPEAVSNTLAEPSPFSALFWTSFALAIVALGLLICWYCGSRQRARRLKHKKPEAIELPRTISEIADLDLPPPDRPSKTPLMNDYHTCC